MKQPWPPWPLCTLEEGVFCFICCIVICALILNPNLQGQDKPAVWLDFGNRGDCIPHQPDNEARHHLCKVFIHSSQTLLNIFFPQNDIFSSAVKWQSLLCGASWSVLTWRQTESLSAQLCNLMTRARGEPCISTVHLSDILELHPSFFFIPFHFISIQGWTQDLKIAEGCHPSAASLSWYVGDAACLVFQSFEQMMFTLSKSCFQKGEVLFSAKDIWNLCQFEMLSIFIQAPAVTDFSVWRKNREFFPGYCWHLISRVLTECSAVFGW